MARLPWSSTRAEGAPAGTEPGGGQEGGQTFSAVRMQREQALMRTGEPLRWTTIGCRFGSQRRSARLRFMPTDCGFQPVIGPLPQISHARAILDLHAPTNRRT